MKLHYVGISPHGSVVTTPDNLLYTKEFFRDIIAIMITSIAKEKPMMYRLNLTRLSYFFNPGLTRFLRTTRTKK